MDTTKQLATDIEQLQNLSIDHGKESLHFHLMERWERNILRARYTTGIQGGETTERVR